MLKKVVLPAPFGPINETIELAGTVKSTSWLATRPPNSLRRCCVSRSASGTGVLRVVQRLVVDTLVQLGGTPLRRDQPLRPEQHRDHENQPEDAELVLRHVDRAMRVVAEPR